MYEIHKFESFIYSAKVVYAKFLLEWRCTIDLVHNTTKKADIRAFVADIDISSNMYFEVLIKKVSK